MERESAPRTAPSYSRGPRVTVLTDVLAAVRETDLPLDVTQVAHARHMRERLATEIEVRLLPRLREENAPAIVVLGGSSGAGKSTIINSLAQEDISKAGVLRPTTREAVLAIHPEDKITLENNPLLDLANVVTSTELVEGVAVLDAPDLDTVSEANRRLSDRLIRTADLWIFVTTARRYGDALPWKALMGAKERGVTLAVALNRVPKDVRTEVHKDLTNRLTQAGITNAPIFLIPDLGPHEGPLPAEHVEELKTWLGLVARSHAGERLRQRTTRTTWATLRKDLLTLAKAADTQADVARSLSGVVDRALSEPIDELIDKLESGRTVSGAPTTRWLSLASTGGDLADVVQSAGRLRPGRKSRRDARRNAALTLGQDVDGAVRTNLATAMQQADEAVRGALRESGATVLSDRAVDEAEAARRGDNVVQQWTAAVHSATEQAMGGQDKATQALGVDGTAALVRAGAAGLRGARGSVEFVLGPRNGRLVDKARSDLVELARTEATELAHHYFTAIDDLNIIPGTGLRLRASELKEHS